ncbi:RNA-splicing factor [Coemansia asiatica]|uniref:RNA-splicing factor n=1 Tax=Coemansia asiatica TaxID=1052880 RepID=A0A9W8CHX7_9FUNG|nr:RNA-splicing factor [Coemansia asiatica]
MYNGIGLNTPRGTGTSGHVVRNASALRPRQSEGVGQKRSSFADDRFQKTKPIDQGIIDHERKRHIEIKCLELQDELEEKGLSEEGISSRIDKLRQELLSNIDRVDLSRGGKIKSFETQKIAEAKDRENQQMARALRISNEHVEGEAFDQELQELKRQKMLVERELDQEKRRCRARESATSSSDEDRHHRHKHRHRHSRRAHGDDRAYKRRSRSPRGSAKSSNQSSDEESRERASKGTQYQRHTHRYQHRHQHRHRDSDRSESSEPDNKGDASDSNRDKDEEKGVALHAASPLRDARLVENGEPGEIEDSG